MNPEVKTKWLAALRGGQYKQGQNALRTRDRYCCLGVLCDIVVPDGWERSDSGTYEIHGLSGFPSDEVLAQTGLVSQHDRLFELANMNDNGRSFEEIAAKIEDTL